MKCFNIILFILICSTSLCAKTYSLFGLNNNKVGVGDIITLKVSNEELDYSYLKDYENKRISELLYVLEVYQEKKEIYFKAIIAEKSEKEKVEIEDVFKVSNVNFKYEKVKLDGKFKTLDAGIVLKQSKTYIIIIILALLIIISFYIKKRIQKNKIIKKKSELRSKINLHASTTSREHLENVYKYKDQIPKLYSFNNEAFERFLGEINQVQYKEKWSGDDFEKVTKAYKDFVKSTKESNGI